MTLKSFGRLVGRSVASWIEHDALSLSAAVAFYTVLALSPLLIISVAVASMAFGHAAAQQQVAASLEGLVGPEAAGGIERALLHAHQTGRGGMALAVGVGALVVGALGMFQQLQLSLNLIWNVKSRPGAAIWSFVRKQLLALAMMLLTGVLLVFSLLVTAGLSAAQDSLPAWGRTHWLWLGIDQAAALSLATLLFAAAFKVLPDVVIAWADVWLGALVTACLFAAGKVGIGIYLGRSAVASVYGAAGSIVLVLIWIYYSAAIFFLGAELTQAIARERGRQIVPSRHAVPLR